jgi:hypothetical protein
VNEEDKILHESLNTEQFASYKTINVQIVVYSLLMVLEAQGRYFFIGRPLE